MIQKISFSVSLQDLTPFCALTSFCTSYDERNADLDEMPVGASRGDVENTGNDKLAK